MTKRARFFTIAGFFGGAAACAFVLLPHFASFRSQNILYHLALADRYARGDFQLAGVQVLEHSSWSGQFIDQHFFYNLVLALFRLFLPAEWAAGMISVVAIGAGFLAFQLLTNPATKTGSEAGTRVRQILLTVAVSLLLLLPDPSFVIRWFSGRPAPLQFTFLVLVLLAARRRRPAAPVFLAAFVWAGFSYFALIAPVVVLGQALVRRRESALAGVAAGAVLAGFFVSGGLPGFSYAFDQIRDHVFRDSGIYEWSEPSSWFHRVPLFLSLAAFGLCCRRRASLEEMYLSAIAAGFGLLTFKMARFIDFAWPLALAAFVLEGAPFLRAFGRRRPRALAALTALLFGLFAIQIFRVRVGETTDRSLRPELLGVFREIESKYPGQSILTTEWSSWSAAFFLNPATKIEPGFSVNLYPPATRRLYARFPGKLDSDELGELLKSFETDLLLLPARRLTEVPLPFDVVDDFGAYKLLRVTLPRAFETENDPCSPEPRYAQIVVTDPEFQLRRQTAITAVPPGQCGPTLTHLAGAPRTGEVRVLRTWLKGEPIKRIERITTPASLGHFGVWMNGRLHPSEEVRGGRVVLSGPAESLAEQVFVFDNPPFQLRGRSPYFHVPTRKLVCHSYRAGLSSLLAKLPRELARWPKEQDVATRVRLMATMRAICEASPDFAAPADRRRLAGLCRDFAATLETRAARPSPVAETRSVQELLFEDLGTAEGAADLRGLAPDRLLIEGRAATEMRAGGLFRDPRAETILSGQLALWWVTKWTPIPAGVDEGFERYLETYEKLWRSEFNYHVFMTRWWMEALVTYYGRTGSATASRWIEQFFRAAETMVGGPVYEIFPGCLGPDVPGLGRLRFANHNSALLLEGLEEARRLDFPWWSEREENMLQSLLRCTLALQARAPLYPVDQVGEFVWAPGERRWRPDIQAHFLRALRLRLENDQIRCDE